MRIFEKGNWKNSKRTCPICGTQKEGKVVLVALSGKQEGHNCEAVQVHLDCLELWFDEEMKIIYQKVGEEK